MVDSTTTSRSSKPRLPIEIVEEIVDLLQKDRETLKSLSLASHQFLHRARTHLFAVFIIHAEIRNPASVTILPGHMFLDHIQTFPHLVSYIETIKIIGAELSDAPRNDWVTLDNGLPSALAMFHELLANVGTVSFEHVWLQNMIWPKLPAETRAAFERLLGYRTVKIITLRNFRQAPWTIFENFSPNVKALFLYGVRFTPSIESDSEDEWSDDDANTPDIPAPWIDKNAIKRVEALRLEDLYIDGGTLGCDPTIITAHGSVCPLNLTEIRRVWLWIWDDFSWSYHQEFIPHMNRLLETLAISFHMVSEDPLPPLECSQFYNLRHLHILTGKATQPLPLQTGFLWLCESFQSLPPNNKLQYIDFPCHIGPNECIDYKAQTTWPEVRKGFGWSHIDRVLSQSPFNSLREIRIILTVDPAVKRTAYKALLKSAPVLLPRLMEKGLIVLEETTSGSWRTSD